MMLDNLALNLDEDGIYKLTKIGVKNEASRHFKLNEGTVGQATVFGESLVVGTVRTSAIVSVSQHNDNFLIETKNSIYTLELLDEGV